MTDHLNMDVPSPDSRLLEGLVLQKTGLKIDPARYADLIGTLSAIMHTLNLTQFGDLLRTLGELATTQPAWRQIIAKITIGETYFFRDAAQCRALQTHILPDLIAQRRATGFRHLSIWSAGCATGEEPYSLAILLRELIPDIVDWTFNLIGTDINHASLETARTGMFRARSFRDETRSDIQERWFTERDGTFELHPAVRKMVAFAPLNLIADPYPSFETRTMSVDLILCRNVTIYFEEAATREILGRFHEALNEGGWLIAGHAEPVASYSAGFKPCNFPNAVLYQKQVLPIPEIKPAPVAASALRIAQTIDLPPVKAPAAVKPVPVDALREARSACGREDWQAVERWLAIVAREHPMHPQGHYLRGLMLQHRNDLDGALNAWRRAIYCDASFALAYVSLGELYQRRGTTAEARRCWQQAERAIEDRPADEALIDGDDLTVEMLRDLIDYHLTQLPGEAQS